MKATLYGNVIAESNDIIDNDGYQYFPRAAVHMELLDKAVKTASDLKCPHGVQFYDVVIDGQRHPRAAWSYEAPKASKSEIDHRLGFWKDVKVG